MSITFTIQDGNERLTNYGGLALIGALLDTTRITERVSGIVLPSCATPKISHGDIIASMTGLLSLGLPSFAAIEQFRGDPRSLRKVLAWMPAPPNRSYVNAWMVRRRRLTSF